MFGWEFPPHIAGGLGTACYGMTRGLARNGVEVVFVMPRAYGDEDQRFVRVVNASDVETIGTRDHEFSEELLEKVSFIHIDSNMLPYISPEEYAAYHDEFVRSGRTHEWTDVWKQRYTFSGKYGANLMEEVARYAMVAAQVAKDLEGQFDVIHAHDWLTYFAGIAAKRVSGKPLVVHMHATEFDRSGENINRRVYAIEKAGMQAADRVIAVSELTRRIVIGKYGIPADKVVTVHNAVRFGESEEAAPERAVKDKVVTFLGRITYQKGPDYFVEAGQGVAAGFGRAFRHGRLGRSDEPCGAARGPVGDRRPLPFHGVPQGRGGAADVPSVGCLCHAFGVGAVRHFAARGHAFGRSRDYLAAKRRGGGAGLCY